MGMVAIDTGLRRGYSSLKVRTGFLFVAVSLFFLQS